MDAIVGRLESVVGRITGGGGDDGDVPACVSEYDSFYTGSVQPFVDACNKSDGTKKVGDWTEKAFKHCRNVIDASTQCKKPADADMMKFLGPIVEVITAAQDQDNRSPFFNQHKSFGESIQCLNWILAEGPKATVSGSLDSADFYLSKTLTQAKDKEDPEKTDMREFVKTLKKMLGDLAQYCGDFHKCGIVWKFSGVDLSEYKPGEKAAGGAVSGVEGRLEALAAALEAYHAKMAGSGEDGPMCITAYKEFYTASVEPFINACEPFDGLKAMGAATKKAFEHVGMIIKGTTECKKPSQEAFMTFLGPIVEVITAAGDMDRKSPYFNQMQTFFEAVQSLNFLCMEGAPKGYILGQIEAGSFYSNKVLVMAKDAPDPDKTNHRAWVKTLKEMLTALAEYAHEYFKMGLVWKVKEGIDVKDFKP